MGDFRECNSCRLCCVMLLTMLRVAVSTGLGNCPMYPQLPKFDVDKITGRWYEVERSFYLMEFTASCTEIDVALNTKGYLLITVKTINRWTGNPSISYGLGIPARNGSSSFRYKLNNRMPYIIGRLLPGAGQYNILFTDYQQFAIVWSCNNYGFAHADRFWVLGREREIGAHLRAQIYGLLSSLNLDPDRLIISKNYNCTFVPSDSVN